MPQIYNALVLDRVKNNNKVESSCMPIIIEPYNNLVKKRKVGFRMVNSHSQGQLTKKVSSQAIHLNTAL